MATVLESLLVELGYEFDDASIKKFQEGTQNAERWANRLVTASLAAAAAITAAYGATLKSADDLGKQARTIDIDPAKLLAWKQAAAEVVGSSDGLVSAFSSIQQKLGEYEKGSESAAAAFERLGVSPKDAVGNLRKVDAVLLDVATSLGKLKDRATRQAFASELGIPPEVVALLERGRGGILKLVDAHADLLDINKGQIEAAELLIDQLGRLQSATHGLAIRGMAELAPAIGDVVEQITAWVSTDGDEFMENLAGHTDTLVTALKILAGMLIAIKAIAFAGFLLTLKATIIDLAAPLVAVLATLGPIGWALLAAAAAIGVMVAYKDELMELWDILAKFTGDFLSGTGDKISGFLHGEDGEDGVLDKVGDFFTFGGGPQLATAGPGGGLGLDSQASFSQRSAPGGHRGTTIEQVNISVNAPNAQEAARAIEGKINELSSDGIDQLRSPEEG